MKSLLIRYIDKENIHHILNGELSLNTISHYWNPQHLISDPANLMRQDISEGVSTQIRRDTLKKDLFEKEMIDTVVHDIRFRICAYGYCNICSFFKINIFEMNEFEGNIPLDIDNIVLLAKMNGIQKINDFKDFLKLNNYEKMEILNTIVPYPTQQSEQFKGIINLPDENMDSFGNRVIIIKNQQQFEDLVIDAVKKQGGECIMGDISSHPLMDRIEPKTMEFRTLTWVTKSKGHFTLEKCLKSLNNIIKLGCLDKYDIYGNQNEWRICWLPNIHNFERKSLFIKDLPDIIKILPTRKLREYLMNEYPGYIPGIKKNINIEHKGTINYNEFKNIVENIDSKCEIILETGGEPINSL